MRGVGDELMMDSGVSVGLGMKRSVLRAIRQITTNGQDSQFFPVEACIFKAGALPLLQRDGVLKREGLLPVRFES